MTAGRLPNLFIAGVPKAGTSSLHQWLSDHPEVFGAPEKEVRFFVDPGSHIHRPDFNVANGLEGYGAAFPVPEGAAPRIVLDSTPAYVYQRAALEVIPDLPTRPRCIFVLREPAAQIHSLYAYFRNNWDYIPEAMTFEAFLQAVRTGTQDFGGNELAANAIENARYVDHLRRWRARLGDDRMLVLTFDALRRYPRALMRRVARWTGIDPAFYDGYDFASENETYRPRSRRLQRVNMALRDVLPRGGAYRLLRRLYRRLNTVPGSGVPDAGVMAELAAAFEADNAALAAEFGLDLSGWAGAPGQSDSIDP